MNVAIVCYACGQRGDAPLERLAERCECGSEDIDLDLETTASWETDIPAALLHDTKVVQQQCRCSVCFTEFAVQVSDAADPIPACPKCGGVASAAGATSVRAAGSKTAASGTVRCPECDSKAKLVKSGDGWINRCENCGWAEDFSKSRSRPLARKRAVYGDEHEEDVHTWMVDNTTPEDIGAATKDLHGGGLPCPKCGDDSLPQGGYCQGCGTPRTTAGEREKIDRLNDYRRATGSKQAGGPYAKDEQGRDRVICPRCNFNGPFEEVDAHVKSAHPDFKEAALPGGGGLGGNGAWATLVSMLNGARQERGKIPNWFMKYCKNLLLPEEIQSGYFIESNAGGSLTQGFAKRHTAVATKAAQMAAGILETNPSMPRTEALKLAHATIARYPGMVQPEAKGRP